MRRKGLSGKGRRIQELFGNWRAQRPEVVRSSGICSLPMIKAGYTRNLHAFRTEPAAQGNQCRACQQRLHLAVAPVHGPELLLLDEPAAAVDGAARLDLWRPIEGLRASGATLLLTTHQLADAERQCTRVATSARAAGR